MTCHPKCSMFPPAERDCQVYKCKMCFAMGARAGPRGGQCSARGGAAAGVRWGRAFPPRNAQLHAPSARPRPRPRSPPPAPARFPPPHILSSRAAARAGPFPPLPTHPATLRGRPVPPHPLSHNVEAKRDHNSHTTPTHHAQKARIKQMPRGTINAP